MCWTVVRVMDVDGRLVNASCLIDVEICAFDWLIQQLKQRTNSLRIILNNDLCCKRESMSHLSIVVVLEQKNERLRHSIENEANLNSLVQWLRYRNSIGKLSGQFISPTVQLYGFIPSIICMHTKTAGRATRTGGGRVNIIEMTIIPSGKT